MTNYCKSNVRRVINYTNIEPSNKYDLWLSENLRYNEDGELEYDNNGLPACDLILKIFKNGKWEPIVGYNTASENKINIVKGVNYTYTPINYPHTTHTNYGFQKNHLPLFRDPQDSPDELFDAGTLGEAICGFVTEAEWNSIFQTDWFTSAFNTSVIGGNSYSWGNLIQELISSGDVEIPLANTQRIGGIKAAQDPNTADDCRNIPIVLAGPTVGSVWGLPFGGGTYPGDLDYNTEYLYLPGWALMEWMKNPYFNQQNPQPFITGWKGVDVQLRQNSDLLWVGLSGVIPENTGKVCTVKLDNTDPSGASIEWVDLPEYEELDSSSTDENLYVVRGLDGSNKQNYLLGGNGKWIEKGYGLSVVLIVGSEYKINQNIHKQNDVEIDNITDKYIVFETSNTPIGDEMVNISYDNKELIVNEYQYKKVTISATQKALHFKNISNTEYTNPISIKIIASEDLDLEFTNTKYIYEGDTSLSILPQGTEWLLTFQFGVVKFEEIINPQ